MNGGPPARPPGRAGIMPRMADDRFPPPRLPDTERARLALEALHDGTATRLRVLSGWTLDDMARECNVPTSRLRSWENGAETPAPAAAVKVWAALVRACTACPADAP